LISLRHSIKDGEVEGGRGGREGVKCLEEVENIFFSSIEASSKNCYIESYTDKLLAF
jgi:hypothetical protein